MKNFVLPILLTLFVACSKGSDEENDNIPPVITLNTPVNNQVFTGGQTMMISGLASDNNFIREIHIEITNLATAEEYLHVHIHPDANSFNFDQAFTVQAGINYKIRVIVDDASINSVAVSVEVFSN